MKKIIKKKSESSTYKTSLPKTLLKRDKSQSIVVPDSEKFRNLVCDHVFRGKRTGKSNDIARHIYGAKFFDNPTSFKILTRIVTNDIDPKGWDFIVPVLPRDSRYNLNSRIVAAVAKNLKIKVLNTMSKSNTLCGSAVKGQNILLFDDVIYTGNTMKIAMQACLNAGASKVRYFAIAHSASFTGNTSPKISGEAVRTGKPVLKKATPKVNKPVSKVKKTIVKPKKAVYKRVAKKK
jgi:phosphoribosylpyrophosphate synthetase